jgi:hypothetical protein
MKQQLSLSHSIIKAQDALRQRILLHQGVGEAGAFTEDRDSGSTESGCELTTASFTRATPLWVIPIFSAALFERSRLRP